jgi:hypothetical protein
MNWLIETLSLLASSRTVSCNELGNLRLVVKDIVNVLPGKRYVIKESLDYILILEDQRHRHADPKLAASSEQKQPACGGIRNLSAG